MRYFISIVLLCSLLAISAFGTTWYCSKAGNNTTGKSWANAFTTAYQLNDSVTAGDSVRFGSGRWLNTQLIAVAGSAGDPTVYACSTITSATELNPIISAGDSVKTWVLHSGNIYKAFWHRSSRVGYGADGADINSAFVMTQNDTTIYVQSSLVNVSAPGQFYYNSATDTVYCWLWGSVSPVGQEMLIAGGPTLRVTAGSSYIRFFGIAFKMGKQGVVEIAGNSDSLMFTHCLFQHVSMWHSNNPSLVITLGHNMPLRYSKFSGCWFYDSYCINFPDISPQWDHGGTGLKLYHAIYDVIESCTVLRCAGDGMKIKSTEGANSYGNVFRYNMFLGNQTNPTYDVLNPPTTYGGANTSLNGACIEFDMRNYQDSIYGNYFANCWKGLVLGYIGTGALPYDTLQISQHQILNNTFYNCGYFIEVNAYQMLNKNYFKYNAAYNYTGSYVFSFGEVPGSYASLQDSCAFDSNYWYDPSGAFDVRLYGGTVLSWAQWQAAGKDVNSSHTTNPGFSNAATFNFTRPDAPAEMNQTYGGRTWTIYGAIQPEAAISRIYAPVWR